ncbi:MAG: hypothetical protein Q4P07_10685 [Ornithinimicrobium sp.]|uniref:hypothetical protein n=1 Tax=Ornithinimicrobium sp. TaxID=1977084 RepID=UPI0026DFD338|nr:hypothetical protein [Ornithinimicrobium sp.]MDO5740602.1 hypothetical protein [Ornithinimicrobium sp.]
MRHLGYAALAGLVAFLLSACGPSTPEAPGSASTGTTTSSPTPTATQTETPVRPSDLTPITPKPTQLPINPTFGPGALPTGPVPQSVKDRSDVVTAIADQAKRAGVEVSQVTVAGYADVTWSDGSLGCPKPGMMYTQALVPGSQLILQVGDRLSSYHAAQGKPYSYCANPVPPPRGSATS